MSLVFQLGFVTDETVMLNYTHSTRTSGGEPRLPWFTASPLCTLGGAQPELQKDRPLRQTTKQTGSQAGVKVPEASSEIHFAGQWLKASQAS